MQHYMKIYHHQHHLLLEKSHLPDRRKLSTDVPFKESGTVKRTEFLQTVKVWLGSGRLKQGFVPESNLINRQYKQPDVSKSKYGPTTINLHWLTSSNLPPRVWHKRSTYSHQEESMPREPEPSPSTFSCQGQSLHCTPEVGCALE